MFQPAIRPFSELADALFLPDAFRPPTPPQAPETPADWRSYGPGPEGGAAPPFAEFVRSTAFEQVQAQFLDHIDACLSFARQHFTAQELATITERFTVFRSRLLHQNGDSYFGDTLPLLYGMGKRSFDAFCLRLQDPSLDLHLRKTALRELAGKMGDCVSSGPAFNQALLLLDTARGSLRGEFHQLLRETIDEVLRAYVRHVFATDTESLQASMEVHRVNRLRLELRLPGADPSDGFSLSPHMFRREQLLAVAARLMRDVRPAQLALALAQRYRIHLFDAMSETLKQPTSALDPNTHWDTFQREARRLAARFPNVSPHSLVTHDIDTGLMRWRTDDSLIAHDLMLELQDHGLVPRAGATTLCQGHTEDSQWWLKHFDSRLFFVDERVRGSSHLETGTAGLRHLRFVQRPRMGRTVHEHMTESVLTGERPEVLMGVPLRWLKTSTQAALLLRRLGKERSLRWVRRQDLTPRGRALLLRAATATDDAPVLRHLLSAHEETPSQWLTMAGGPSILAQAVMQENGPTALIWVDMLAQARPSLDTEGVIGALSRDNGQPLAHGALLRRDPELLDTLLALTLQAREADQISDEQLAQLLVAPVAQAMALGRLGALDSYVEHLILAAEAGWLPAGSLRRLLEGPSPGLVGVEAARTGLSESLRWFHRTVVTLVTLKLLPGDQAGEMLTASPMGADAAQVVAIRRGHADALKACLDAAADCRARGWIAEEPLRYVFEARNLQGTPALGFLVEFRRPCLTVWRTALLEAYGREELSQRTIMKLLQANDGTQRDPISRLIVQRGSTIGLEHWWDLIAECRKEQAVSQAQWIELLESRAPAPTHGPVLHAAITAWLQPAAIDAYMGLYGRAREAGLLSDEEFERLLRADDYGPTPRAALATAVLVRRYSAVARYLSMLSTLAQKELLTPAALSRLLGARAADGCPAIILAASSGQGEMLRMMLAALRGITVDGLLGREQWRELVGLTPQGDDAESDGAAGVPWSLPQAIAHRGDPQLMDVLREAVDQAADSGVIGPIERLRITWRLDDITTSMQRPQVQPSTPNPQVQPVQPARSPLGPRRLVAWLAWPFTWLFSR